MESQKELLTNLLTLRLMVARSLLMARCLLMAQMGSLEISSAED